MKIRAMALLLALLLLLPAGPGLAQGEATTILVYICGADLESEDRSATDDLREMTRAGIPAGGDITLLVETGGTKQWHLRAVSGEGNQRFLVTEAGLQPLSEELGRRNMGEAETLADFLRWGLSYAPAERTVLILWDHGGGPLEGVCFDELFREDPLEMSEMAAALEAGLGGARLDAVVFDACLMADYEVAAALAPYADWMVASQETVPGNGLTYLEWLQALVKNPQLDTVSLCREMVDTVVADASGEKNADTVTFSLVNLSKIAAVTEALEALGVSGQALLSEGRGEALRAAGDALLSFGEFLEEDAEPTDLMDIPALCEALKTLLPREAAALKTAALSAVAYNAATADMVDNAQGLSVYWPATATGDYPEYLDLYPTLTGSPAYAAFVSALGNEIAPARENEGPLHDGHAAPAEYPGLWDGLTPAETWTDEPGQEAAYPGLWQGIQGVPETQDAPEGEYPGLWDGLNAA